MPPPLELIAKTVYIEPEQVLTGAPIAFVRLEKFAGGNLKEAESLGKSKSEKEADKDPTFQPEVDLKPDVASLRTNAANI